MSATEPRKRAPASIMANLKNADDLLIYGRSYTEYTKRELAAFIYWLNQEILEAYERPRIALRKGDHVSTDKDK